MIKLAQVFNLMRKQIHVIERAFEAGLSADEVESLMGLLGAQLDSVGLHLTTKQIESGTSVNRRDSAISVLEKEDRDHVKASLTELLKQTMVFLTVVAGASEQKAVVDGANDVESSVNTSVVVEMTSQKSTTAITAKVDDSEIHEDAKNEAGKIDLIIQGEVEAAIETDDAEGIIQLEVEAGLQSVVVHMGDEAEAAHVFAMQQAAAAPVIVQENDSEMVHQVGTEEADDMANFIQGEVEAGLQSVVVHMGAEAEAAHVFATQQAAAASSPASQTVNGSSSEMVDQVGKDESDGMANIIQVDTEEADDMANVIQGEVETGLQSVAVHIGAEAEAAHVLAMQQAASVDCKVDAEVIEIMAVEMESQPCLFSEEREIRLESPQLGAIVELEAVTVVKDEDTPVIHATKDVAKVVTDSKTKKRIGAMTFVPTQDELAQIALCSRASKKPSKGQKRRQKKREKDALGVL
ncbi:hypothetical protein HDU67_000790 [Dinochytrium kinnereticum]|nr:hypothetical protein HDU67_000790 [Dinochytrium kinnereticum]